MPSSHVFTVPPELHGALDFLGELPLIPPTAAECDCKPFYDTLERHGLIRPLDALRVCEVLEHTMLPHVALGRLLKWFVRMQRTRLFADAEVREQFKAAVRVEASPSSAGSGTRRLAEFRTHALGGLRVPYGLPLPPLVLPHEVCAHLSEGDCEGALGLSKISFEEWWDVVGTHACVEAVATAPLVLGVVARQSELGWGADLASRVLEALRRRRCITVQTSAGSTTTLALPSEAYMPSEALNLLSKLCLPVATGLSACRFTSLRSSASDHSRLSPWCVSVWASFNGVIASSSRILSGVSMMGSLWRGIGRSSHQLMQ